MYIYISLYLSASSSSCLSTLKVAMLLLPNRTCKNWSAQEAPKWKFGHGQPEMFEDPLERGSPLRRPSCLLGRVHGRWTIFCELLTWPRGSMCKASANRHKRQQQGVASSQGKNPLDPPLFHGSISDQRPKMEVGLLPNGLNPRASSKAESTTMLESLLSKCEGPSSSAAPCSRYSYTFWSFTGSRTSRSRTPTPLRAGTPPPFWPGPLPPFSRVGFSHPECLWKRGKGGGGRAPLLARGFLGGDTTKSSRTLLLGQDRNCRFMRRS